MNKSGLVVCLLTLGLSSPAMAADGSLASINPADTAWILVAQRTHELCERDRVLRYLAVIDPSATPALRVGPVAVGPDHPAASLAGSQALVAFSTRRYAEHPLIVQGAGAGGEVTASGVLGEVLRIAKGLSGSYHQPITSGWATAREPQPANPQVPEAATRTRYAS
jgi:homoserine dehydrogenase